MFLKLLQCKRLCETGAKNKINKIIYIQPKEINENCIKQVQTNKHFIKLFFYTPLPLEKDIYNAIFTVIFF